MEGFCKKNLCPIRPFSRKNREPEWPYFSDLGERKLNSGLATKLKVFVKNAINSFFLDVQYKKKLLVTFPPKTLPLEVIGGTFSLSWNMAVVQ